MHMFIRYTVSSAAASAMRCRVKYAVALRMRSSKEQALRRLKASVSDKTVADTANLAVLQKPD